MPGIFGGAGVAPDICAALRTDFATTYGASEAMFDRTVAYSPDSR